MKISLRLLLFCAAVTLLGVVITCSSDDASNGGGAVPCPKSGDCGQNASCSSSSDTCKCRSGFEDCNQDLDEYRDGDGCECAGDCDGKQCKTSVASGDCDPDAEGSCRSTREYCDAGSETCQSCGDRYNCDGENGASRESACESTDACSQSCDPDRPDDCYDDQYCDGSSCAQCPSDSYNCDGDSAGSDPCEAERKCCSPTEENACAEDETCDDQSRVCTRCPGGDESYNCDRVGPCDSADPCSGDGCLKACNDGLQYDCVRNGSGTCVPCLENKHCKANDRALGPICDSNEQCTCEGPSDCSGRTTGPKCLEPDSGPKFCGCERNSDCDAPYERCDTERRISVCQPLCQNEDDCERMYGDPLVICQDDGTCLFSQP